LEVESLKGHWGALRRLYESESPVELSFSHLEHLVFKDCYLRVAVVLELLHHVPVVFPRLMELMVDQGKV
jgi:nucleosome binding factor SPN SPT16 subunit